jgi:phosphoribosylamine-glycine ligase
VLFVAPGNAGTATSPACENVAIEATDIEGLWRFAREPSRSVSPSSGPKRRW